MPEGAKYKYQVGGDCAGKALSATLRGKARACSIAGPLGRGGLPQGQRHRNRHVIWLKNAQWLQILALVHPFSRRGVARHAPVASRTQAAATHFGTIGEAATLELLREETPEKRFETMFYDIV